MLVRLAPAAKIRAVDRAVGTVGRGGVSAVGTVGRGAADRSLGGGPLSQCQSIAGRPRAWRRDGPDPPSQRPRDATPRRRLEVGSLAAGDGWD